MRTTYQNLWDTMKAVLRGEFISWSAFNKRRKTTTRTTNKQPNTTAQSPNKRRTERHKKQQKTGNS